MLKNDTYQASILMLKNSKFNKVLTIKIMTNIMHYDEYDDYDEYYVL